MRKTTPYYHVVRGPRGVVLITAMWIAIALTAVVLVLCREMMVESLTTKQHLAQAEVDAAEIGAEQYVLSVLEQEITTPGYHDQVKWERRQIGGQATDSQSGCYFWVIGVNIDDETQPYFNLVDEASKIDLNTSLAEMLDYLPGMDTDPTLSQAIVDWRDADEDTSYSSDTGGQGAESDIYEAQDPPYHAKNLSFESVEELRLIYNMTDEIMYGADTNHNNRIEDTEQSNAAVDMSFRTSMRGLVSYVTAWGVRATNLPATVTPPVETTDADGNTVQFADINSTANSTTPTTTTTTNSTGSYQSLLSLLNYYSVRNASQIVTATTNWITGQTSTTGGRGGPTAAATTVVKPFRSVAEWMTVVAQNASANSEDLYPIYTYLVCNQPQSTSSTTTTTTTVTTNSTSNTTTLTIEGVTTIESYTTNDYGDTVAIYAPAGMININTATKPVLMALPGFEETDADTIIDYRENNLAGQNSLDIPNITWLLDLGIEPTKLALATPYMTGKSTVFSADIVTVSGDGRAFKRMMIVVDTSSGAPQIIYRRDLTDYGWPLDPQIRKDLRESRQR